MKKVLLFAAMISIVVAMVPGAAFAWTVGDTQTNEVHFTFTQSSTLDAVAFLGTPPFNLVEHWTGVVTAIGVTPTDQNTDNAALGLVATPPGPVANYPMFPSIEVTVADGAGIVPLSHTIQPPWNGAYGGGGSPFMAIRETYTGPGAIGTAGILGSTAYNAMSDGRQLKQISNQAIGGGFMMNAAYVYIDYGAGYPVPPYNVTTHVMASNGGLQWLDVMTPTSMTFGGYFIPGCPIMIPTVQTTLAWLSTTGFNPTPLPLASAMYSEVAYCPTCDVPGAIMAIQQTDSYHFATLAGPSPETQFAVAANPCPCVPEVATIILISVGLIGLAGFVLLKRRAAITA